MLRRSLFKKFGGLLLAPAISLPAMAAGGRKPVLRVAHITDVHLHNKAGAPDHFRKCLHHIQSQSPKVDFILNGGDIVFDMNKENLSAIDAQWQLLHSIMKEECSLPVHYALGNHDIWWSEQNKGQAVYGKQYAMDQLKLDAPYYSFVKGGWKFIVLDSVHLDIDNTWYIGKLGEAQMKWLTEELRTTAKEMPVCVLSHIPILTATLMVQDNIVNRWEMLGGDMHTDTADIIRLFYQHPNVRLCLSGHIHLRDKVVYNNVTYLCNGAVSGAWWEGNNRETGPGYGLVELFADGSFTERYVNYQ
ncbi:metallophosphoesterase family protein [Chitinophaga rhizophila]|uniref:Metallophosphoesterase n=1 Tax=Chitinophaga rhizophila TaxID=2866212 RepID=A0ABS7GHY6_9BACT|nr:metallophosphoesterase [Chitinophaga rhizophila]MBW8687288.1 metallophosphoesterase [Chitinophaga rhizophila]